MNTEKDIQKYIEREKEIKPNPWLATRIMTRIETPDQRMAPRWQSAFLAASILFAVLLGIGLGKVYSPVSETYAGLSIDDSDIEGFAYFNLESDE